MKITAITERAIAEVETFRTTMRELGSCSPAVEKFNDEVIVRIIVCGSPKAAVETAMRNLLNELAEVTTLTTRASLDAFRDRMCDHFGQLPDELGNQHLHVEQSPLGPDEYFTHRLDSDGHHIVYDPRQTSGLMVRQFLGIYATFTEDPVPEGVRDAYYEAKAAGAQTILKIVLAQIDRTQDAEGVMDQTLELLQQADAKTKTPAA